MSRNTEIKASGEVLLSPRRLRFFEEACCLMLLLAVLISSSQALPQGSIDYQGRLTTPAGQPVADGSYNMTFRIYDQPTGGTILWTSGGSPISVAVSGGLFSVELGGGLTTPFPFELFVSSPRYVGITVGSDAEMFPRTQLSAAPYAVSARRADSAGHALDANTASSVMNNSIYNSHVNPAAEIAPSKISGTAATLSATQMLTGANTFSGSVSIGDSTFRASTDGLIIGTSSITLPQSRPYLMYMKRKIAETADRYGIWMQFENSSTGDLAGITSIITGTGTTGGHVTGGEFIGRSNGLERYGIKAEGSANSGSTTTGTSCGVLGTAANGAVAYGVIAQAGWTTTGYGVYGSAFSATSIGYGVYGTALMSPTNWAGYFAGNVHVTGTLTKGAGAFRIDHPLDPENKYLQHSFVESPDMKNIYDGIVTLDAYGQAVVALPEWFEPLNQDFRYQLTCIGAYAPVYIKTKIAGNQFKIAGGTPSLEVSWQVTGIRHDNYAEANRIPVELDKKSDERGKYAHPEAFSLPVERGIDYEHSKLARERGMEALRE